MPRRLRQCSGGIVCHAADPKATATGVDAPPPGDALGNTRKERKSEGTGRVMFKNDSRPLFFLPPMASPVSYS